MYRILNRHSNNSYSDQDIRLKPVLISKTPCSNVIDYTVNEETIIHFNTIIIVSLG